MKTRGTPPTLRQLELLLALASSEGVASAGAKLGMSASATSHALRGLEKALGGAALVERNAPGMGLTHTGSKVLPHVRDVFASLQLIQATALAGAELKEGMLRLGSFGASATTKVLPLLVDRFNARYPGIEVVVTEKPAEQTVRDLIERRLELAAVPLPQQDLESVPLALDELVAVLPAAHRLASLETVPLKELAAEPFIMTRAGSQPLVTRLFERNGLQPKIAFELLQILSILEMVEKGKGVSMLARLAVPDHYEGVVYRPVAPGSSRRIGLVCLDAQRLSPVAHALWSEAKRHQPAAKPAARR